VKSSAFRAAFASLALALGLAACLTSDAPNLSPADLTEPTGLVGSYFATAFPEDATNSPGTIDATLEAIGERVYRLTFAEGEHKDEPVLLRFMILNDGTLLGVFSDPDPAKGAMYAMVTHASNGGWIFRTVDFQEDRRDQTLRDALTRHGADSVDFGTGQFVHNEVKGSLTAANLRALFSDAGFVQALEMEHGFRLSPKTPESSGTALD